VNASINTAKVQSPELASVALTNPQIEQIVRKNISGDLLKGQSEQAIDSIYTWLNGDTTQPSVKITLSQQKQQIAQDISTYAIERLQGLPVCTRPPATSDLFAVNCRVPGQDLNKQKAYIADTLLKDTEFLPDTELTLDELLAQQQGQTFFEKYQNIPKYFQLMKISPYVLLGLSLIIAALLLAISSSKVSAVKTIGWTLVSSGIFVIFIPLIYSLFTPTVTSTNPSPSAIDITPVITNLFQQIYSDLADVYIKIGGIAISLGVILILSAYAYARRNPSSKKVI
jgi:hypothetical protein